VSVCPVTPPPNNANKVGIISAALALEKI